MSIATYKQKVKNNKRINHLYITQKKGICGGSPIISGTRTPIRSIVGYYKMGLSPEEILEGLPYLTLSQIYDALSYYFDHQEEIEMDIARNTEEELMKKYPETILKNEYHQTLS